jgi:hypothetical protein
MYVYRKNKGNDPNPVANEKYITQNKSVRLEIKRMKKFVLKN